MSCKSGDYPYLDTVSVDTLVVKKINSIPDDLLYKD